MSNEKAASRPMRASRVTMSEIVMPNDTNPHGTLSGGRLMHWIDIAAAMAAMRHARCPVVTVAIDEVAFHAPVPGGFIVTLNAQVSCVGRTSMELKVDVIGEDPVSGESCHTTTAHLVFVAVDEDGRPTPVPEVEAETDEEKALQERGRERRARRLGLRKSLPSAL